MKKLICFMMIFSLLVMKISAQEISDTDNSLIDNFVKSNIAVTKEKIVSDTLQKVFDGTFYKVGIGFSYKENGGTLSNEIYAVRDGAVFAIESRTDSMFTLLSLIRKDFYLRGETDARLFETSLDKLDPMDMMNIEYKAHLKINNKWYFIRNKFFDSKSGYIITVDKNLKISKISYSLEAIKK